MVHHETLELVLISTDNSLKEKITSAGIVVTNRVFVGGIPNWMNEIKLQLEFEELNMLVKDTRIVEDMKTGKPKGYGFVTFFDTTVAEDLIQKGCVNTKSGLKFRISTAIRKKALELRLQQSQSNMQKLSSPNHCIQPTNTTPQYVQLPSTPPQTQFSNFYPPGSYYVISNPDTRLCPQPSPIGGIMLYNRGYYELN